MEMLTAAIAVTVVVVVVRVIVSVCLLCNLPPPMSIDSRLLTLFNSFYMVDC